MWFSNHLSRYFWGRWHGWICIFNKLSWVILTHTKFWEPKAWPLRGWPHRIIQILRDQISKLILRTYAPDSVLIKNLVMYNYYQSAKSSEFMWECSQRRPGLFLHTMYIGLSTIRLILHFTFKAEGCSQILCILAQGLCRTQPMKGLYKEVRKARPYCQKVGNHLLQLPFEVLK